VDCKLLFETYHIEKECKDVELSVTSGYKIYLNVTEWLILNKPLQETLNFNEINKCYLLNVYLPLYENENNDFFPQNTHDFIENFEHTIVKAKPIRGYRFIFNRDYGNYHIGRHFTNVSSDLPSNMNDYDSIKEINMSVFWCGYYPINEIIWNRKLNVKTNMNINIEKQPIYNRNTSRQHFYSLDEMKEEYKEYLNLDNHVDKFKDAIAFCKKILDS
jgi:hypothetical protein